MARYYFYKMTTDDGGAPCCSGGLLSLAICKPAIRSTAREGDLIFGFAADSIGADHGLIYVAEVTTRLIDGEYYKRAEYSDRGDCIYDWDGQKYSWRPGKEYHLSGEMLAHDLGAPDQNYHRANTLLSDRFRYFGTKRFAVDTAAFPSLADALRHLKQGHRVNYPERLRLELKALRDVTFEKFAKLVNGAPTHVTPGKCQDQDESPHQCV